MALKNFLINTAFVTILYFFLDLIDHDIAVCAAFIGVIGIIGNLGSLGNAMATGVVYGTMYGRRRRRYY